MINQELRAKMRPYQIEALDAMLANHTLRLEYDDMGLGKTLTTMASIYELEAFPCVIVCPKFALSVWQVELLKWLNEDSVILSGTPKEREKQWAEFMTGKYKFLITNFAMIGEVAERSGILIKRGHPTKYLSKTFFKWNGFIADEIHMGGLFNQKTQTYKAVKKFTKDITHKFLLTGTPIRQGCIDMYGPLSIIDPVRFDSYWKFVQRWCVTIQTPFGKSIERNPANIQAFRGMLRQYMVRRVKEEVLEELPGKQRNFLYFEMGPKIRKAYDEIMEELMTFVVDTDELILTPNALTQLVRTRQLLACPPVLGYADRGSAIDTMLEHSHLSMDAGKPIAIFTSFRQAVPFFEAALKEEYPGIEVYKITGGLSAQEFGAAWQGFQNSKNPCRALICVIKSGASFQATAASTAYFIGPEWDFTLNAQAEDRLNRMGQKDFVNVYYLTCRDTVDERVLLALNEKKFSSDWITGTPEQFREIMSTVQNKKR